MTKVKCIPVFGEYPVFKIYIYTNYIRECTGSCTGS